jgi:hypothetical protein
MRKLSTVVLMLFFCFSFGGWAFADDNTAISGSQSNAGSLSNSTAIGGGAANSNSSVSSANSSTNSLTNGNQAASSVSINSSSVVRNPNIFPDYPAGPQGILPQYFGNPTPGWNTIESGVWAEKTEWWEGDYGENKSLAKGQFQLVRINPVPGDKKNSRVKRIEAADLGNYVVAAKVTLYQGKKDDELSFDNLWFKSLEVNSNEIHAPNVFVEKIGYSNGGYNTWGRNFNAAGAGQIVEGGIGSLIGALAGGFWQGKAGVAATNYTYMVVKFLYPRE